MNNQEKAAQTQPECGVCLEPCEDSGACATGLHPICETCVGKWIRKGNATCPICRAELWREPCYDSRTLALMQMILALGTCATGRYDLCIAMAIVVSIARLADMDERTASRVHSMTCYYVVTLWASGAVFAPLSSPRRRVRL